PRLTCHPRPLPLPRPSPPALQHASPTTPSPPLPRLPVPVCCNNPSGWYTIYIMHRHSPSFSELLSAKCRAPHDLTLKAYLLGTVDFETALRFQRRLQFEVSESRSHGALVLCEHPPLITIGRQVSHGHLRLEEDARAPR